MKRRLFAIFAIFFVSFPVLADNSVEWRPKRIKWKGYLKGVATANSWDMTCIELREYLDSLADQRRVAIVTEAQSMANVEHVLAGHSSVCNRHHLRRIDRHYRIHTSNRYCRVTRCGLQIRH